MEHQEELPLVLMEPAKPPSPSIFLKLPPMLHAEGGKDHDLVLPYISRLLMEEDTDADKLSQQYPENHPALVEAERCYAQIISEASSTNALDSWPSNSSAIELSPLQLEAAAPYYSDNNDVLSKGNNLDSMFFLNGTSAKGTVEPSSKDMVTMAFFKGMEEANKFLFGARETMIGRGRKKRLDDDDIAQAEVGICRSNKQKAVPPQPESEEEAVAHEMLAKLMLDGHNADADAQESRVDTEMEKKPQATHAVDLHTMLIRCAEAIASNDQGGATALLLRIKSHSSPTGDGAQRLAHYFAEALEARLAGTGRQIYRSLMEKRMSNVGILTSYRLCTESTCFLNIHFLFSNQIIYKTIAGRTKLHVVQYGLHLWFQWPDLLRRLAHRDGGPPEVRLTAIDTPQPGFRPAQLIEETGRRIGDCARQFGVPFKFRGITARSENVRVHDLGIDPNEVLIVNNLFHLGKLRDESTVVDWRNPRDMVLSTIKKMRPKVFINVAVNGSSNTTFFPIRFREALFRYSALFDMTDTIMPRDCEKRLLVEQVYALYAMNVIACEGVDRVERHQSYKQWQAWSQQVQLRHLPLDPEIVMMIKDKVKKEYHRYFLIEEDDPWLLMGWKGRVLYALSAWTANDD
ncbi:hypothetical protein ACP70R_008783 [Stipagrostis hirtigluma subsp. patula]